MHLSVIIPIFNVEAYVGKALESVFGTTASVDDFEVIVINDGSSDGTMGVVRLFADRPNLTVLEQENRGLSVARMRGISVATGDYVWMIDSSDELVEDGVGKVLRLITEKPEAEVLMFPLMRTNADETGNRVDYAIEEEEGLRGKSAIRTLGLPLWPSQRFVFRRSLAEDQWLFFPDVRSCQDEYFGPVLVYLAARVRVMSEPVCVHRVRSGSVETSQMVRLPYDRVAVNQLLMRFVDQRVESEDKDWFRADCFKRLHALYTKAVTPDFRRFARSEGGYIWRQWLKVHPATTLKNKYGRLFYYLFPGFRQRMLDGWSSIRKSLDTVARRLLYLLPVQRNKVVFLNFAGKGYGDNPKCIAEEMLRRKLPCKLVWLVDGNAYVPDSIKKAERNGMSGFYALSTAGIIINNCKVNFPSGYKKKRKQFYLQTWHGDFALKYIEKEIEDSLQPSYVAKSKADSAMTDAVISGSQSFSQILRESFWLPEHCSILEYGVPRNDIYFRGNTYRDELKQRYGFSLDDRILLYAPTFRDHGETDCYDLDFESLRRTWVRKTGDHWKVIIRLHPNMAELGSMFSYGENIINGTAYPDQQELSMVSDCLITDYSSIMGDFFLMRKPVFLYVPDQERYASRSAGRGLRALFYQLPLAHCQTQHELEEQIALFDRESYEGKVDSFMKEYYRPFDDGHASERVVDCLVWRRKQV